MASGSVTRRFLFSTSFLSLEHLWDTETLVKGQTRVTPRHHAASVSPLGDRADPVGGFPLPAQALGDELQVVVGRHELLKVGEFADA